MKISASVAYELADFARSRSRYGYEVGTADPTTFLSSEASDIVSTLVRSFLTTVKVIDPVSENEDMEENEIVEEEHELLK